jgi:multicomponent Na+:H+ antiporter subunit E
MRYLQVLLIVSLFWLVLSGHFTLLLLSFGLLSALIVTWFVRGMDRADGVPNTLRIGPRLLRYLAWLAWEVVLANVDLVRRIWDPALPVRPTWQRLDTRVSTPLEKTIYANSITLTPGTLTTDVQEDHFMVHSLSPEGLEELRKGDMERRIRELGV